MERPERKSKTLKKFELFIKAEDLKNLESNNLISPHCKVQLKHENGQWVDVFMTEVVERSSNPKWTRSVIIDHCFEKDYLINFVVSSGEDTLGVIECSSAAIIAKQPFITHIFKSIYDQIAGRLIIKAEEVRNVETKLTLQLKGIGLDKKDLMGKSDPFLIFYRNLSDDTWIESYRTEVIRNTLDPV